MTFETARCRVRGWRDDDAARVFDIYSRWEVSRWLGRTPRLMAFPSEATKVIQAWNAQNAGQRYAGRWAVERKADLILAGTILLVPLPDGEGEVEVGWHFHPDSWGQGLATEAARGAIDYGFGHGLDEILAVVRPDNEKSLAVCRRLDMQGLGRTTRYYDTELELFRATPYPGARGPHHRDRRSAERRQVDAVQRSDEE